VLSVQRRPAELAAEFDAVGAVLVPDVLPPDLIRRTAVEVSSLLAEDGPHVFKERDDRTVRAVYGLHQRGGVWREIAQLPALAEIVSAIFGEEFYLFQWKLNPKSPMTGDRWEWHRDYVYWKTADGMPAPRAVTAAVFLSDVTPEAGPTRVIRGSHRLPSSRVEQAQLRHEERVDGDDDWTDFVADGLPYTVPDGEAMELCNERGVVDGIGPAGTVLLFHSNAIHGSLVNTSAAPRIVGFLTFNPLTNAPLSAGPRPAFFVNTDPVPFS